MKTLKEILGEELIQRIQQENAEASKDHKSHFHPDLRLFLKWAYRVKEDWYGFSLGETVPSSWVIAIELFLRFMKQEVPDFKILQIKLKFGGLRMYLEIDSDNNYPLEYKQ